MKIVIDMNTLNLAMFNLMELHEVASKHPNQLVSIEVLDDVVRLTTSSGISYDTGV